MSTGYTGSNFGFISTNNSGNGTLTTGTPTTSFTYENVQNATSCNVFLHIGSVSTISTLNVYSSNDVNGTNPIVSTFKTITESQTFNIPIEAEFLKIELDLESGASLDYTIQTIFKNSVLPILNEGVISPGNSIVNGTIAANTTQSGTYEIVENYSLICIDIKGTKLTPLINQPTLTISFSMDGQTFMKTISITILDITSTTEEFNPSHTILPIAKYFKVDLINNDLLETLNNVQLSVLYHKTKSKGITYRLDDKITNHRDVETTKSVLFGKTQGTLLQGGHYQNVSTLNGNLCTSISSPNTAFGEVLTAHNSPFVQFDFSSGRPLDALTIYQNKTSNIAYNFQDSKGTVSVTGGSDKILQMKSNQFTKYKAGQGSDNRFTAVFSNYTENFNQYAGIFTPEDSLCFGYFSGTSEFAIRYQRFGQQQITQIAISVVSPPSGTLRYNVGGTLTSGFLVDGLDANAIAQRSAEQIEELIDAGYYGFSCQYYEASSGVYHVIAVLNGCELNGSSNVSLSVFDTAPTNVTINFTTLRNTGLPTTSIIPQNDWNIDTCKDMATIEDNYNRNPSGFHLDPTKGNVFKITFQYLGFGSILFSVESTETGVLLPVHQIKYTNTATTPSLRDPNLRIGIGVEALSGSDASTTISVATTSCASFLQGTFLPPPIYRSYGIFLAGNKEKAFTSNVITRENPAILFGIQGTSIYTSTNSDSTTNYVINNNNIYLKSLTLSVNAESNNTNANITMLLIKNPTTLNTYASGTPTPGGIIPIQKINESLINTIDGVVLTDTGSGTIDTGYTTTGGDIILETVLIQKQSTTLNLSDYNIVMTPSDSYYICFFGTADGTGNADIDISGSISYNINM